MKQDLQKMYTEVKDKWLKALRSGEYRQTKGALKDSVGYCCLGVLCDLHAKETGREWKPYNGDMYSYDNNEITLPLSVILWSGVADQNPDIGDHCLAVYNDGDGIKGIRSYTFAEIANMIEKEL